MHHIQCCENEWHKELCSIIKFACCKGIYGRLKWENACDHSVQKLLYSWLDISNYKDLNMWKYNFA
jgi:hypothetical protein